MPRNPVEGNVVTRFILGFAVLTLMYVVGGAVGGPLVSMAGPVAGFIGVFVVAFVAFVLFARWYVRYDASFGADSE